MILKKNLINVFLESLLSESFPSLGVTVHFTSVECPLTLCWSLDLLREQLRFWSAPTPLCSCLWSQQLSDLVCFLLWGLSFIYNLCIYDLLYITQTQSLPGWSCSINLQLVKLVGGFWVFFLSHTPLGFNCGFISTSGYGLSTGVCSWGCPGGLRFAPVRARCGDGAAA